MRKYNNSTTPKLVIKKKYIKRRKQQKRWVLVAAAAKAMRRRGHPIVIRSMSAKAKLKPKPSKTAKSGGIVMHKLHKISVLYISYLGAHLTPVFARGYTSALKDGAEFYRQMTPTEYVACRKAVEDLLSNPPCKNDPTYDKRQSDWLCHRYFSRIQESRKEMADFVLVESMAVKSILVMGCWAHLNFKAKHKDVGDSSADIYFAELDVPNKEVTYLTKLDIDLSADTSAYKCCAYCHRDAKGKRELSVGGKGCVYHPVDVNVS